MPSRHGDIQYIEADSQQLPFQDDYFQVVSVAFGLRNIADTDLGFKRDDSSLQTRRPNRDP